MSCFIEDCGYEAVAHYPAVPEGNGTTRKPVGEGKLPSDIVCSIRVIAAGCGLGEIGWSKVFLTKKYGPRVRLGLIFTDCELEPDPILDTGTLCLHCGACARGCIRSCMDVLERSGRIEQTFHNKYFKKDRWKLPLHPENILRGVNPYREEYLDKHYPGIRENEYEKKV